MSDIAQASDRQQSILTKFASTYSLAPAKMLSTLKATAFKLRDGSAPSDEQMMALLVVADQYGLNPFTKEIYAFPDKGGIVPVVGVDGWSRIINSNDAFDGMDFNYSETTVNALAGQKHAAPEWCECVIYRKDRANPIRVREYLDEVYQPPRNGYAGPWQTHTRRFMRHKAMIQCARLAFGFVGIYDQDEAERIIEADVEVVKTAPDLGTYSEDEKKEFDILIETSNDFGMWVFMSGLDHAIQTNLYNSFEKGKITKYKNIVSGMTKSGRDIELAMVQAIGEALEGSDEAGIIEIIDDLSDTEIRFLSDRLSADGAAEVMRLSAVED